MKQIVLSDHANDQAQLAKKQREDEFRAAMERHDELLAERQSRIDEAKARSSEAWKEKRTLPAIGFRLLAWWRSMTGRPRRPAIRQPSQEETVWQAGNQGENLVADHLAKRLGEDWTLVSGYKNSKGEIDQVLIGPSGLTTIEIKYVNGSVSVEGDSWFRDKYDNYGNLVESRIPIADRRGRSPSRQLNEATEKLVSHASKRLPGLRATPIVVLAHPKSEIESVVSATAIPVTLDTWDLEQTLGTRSNPLQAQQQAELIEILWRDHAYHARPRPPRSAPPAALAGG